MDRSHLRSNPAYRPVMASEYLAMNLGDVRTELVAGMIWARVDESPRHAAIAANLIIALGNRLRGTGCRRYGSDLAVQTGEASIRLPDVSVYCRDLSTPVDPDAKLLGTPRVIFEVLSPSTASNDQITKLAEYRAMPGVEEIVFIDPDTERFRIVRPEANDGINGDWLPTGSDLALVSLDVSAPHREIFATD